MFMSLQSAEIIGTLGNVEEPNRSERRKFRRFCDNEQPPVNAQRKQFHKDMMQVMDEISDRDDSRVAILTGAGKCFSADADLKAKAERMGTPG